MSDTSEWDKLIAERDDLRAELARLDEARKGEA